MKKAKMPKSLPQHLQPLADELAAQGHRVTTNRLYLLDLLRKAEVPVDVDSLLRSLAALQCLPNKTTLYRELEYLLAHNLVQELDFGEGKKRYESSTQHHHHLICKECGSVEPVEIDESDLLAQENSFGATHGFTVTKHMLEFFGVCKRCGHNQKI